MVGAISSAVLALLSVAVLRLPEEYDLSNLRTAFIWGYGHSLIYCSLTAIGGTLAALLEQVASGDEKLGRTVSALTLTVPVAGFLATIALLRRVSEWAACSRWLMAAWTFPRDRHRRGRRVGRR